MKKIQQIILAFMFGIVPLQSAWAVSKADELVEAASNGDLEQVKTLIEKEGIDINARETEYEIGETALIGASTGGQLEVVKYLISKGADINIKDNDGVTALMMASAKGHLEVVKYLIDNGADINAKASVDTTSLMVASYYEHLEVVKYLISKGADVNVVAKIDEKMLPNSTTALDFAKTDAIKEVLKNAGAKSAKEIKK